MGASEDGRAAVSNSSARAFAHKCDQRVPFGVMLAAGNMEYGAIRGRAERGETLVAKLLGTTTRTLAR